MRVPSAQLPNFIAYAFSPWFFSDLNEKFATPSFAFFFLQQTLSLAFFLMLRMRPPDRSSFI